MPQEHELLWAEKYRPRSLDEIVDQEDVVIRLKKFVEERNTPHLLFAGPPGTGKCVTGDTPVLTPSGPIPIAELVEKRVSRRLGEVLLRTDDIVIYTLDPRGRIVEARISHVYRGKASRLIRLKTRMGREVKLTPTHPLLVNREGMVEWIPAEKIKVGDRIAVPRMITLPEHPLGKEDEEGIVRAALLLGAKGCRATCFSREAAERLASITGGRVDGRTVVLEECSRDLDAGVWRNAEALRVLVNAYLECFSRVSSRGVEAPAPGRAGVILSYALLALGVVARITGDRIIIEDRESLSRLLESDLYHDSRRSLLEEAAEIALEPTIPVGRLTSILLSVLGGEEAGALAAGEVPAEKLREAASMVTPKLQEELLRMEDMIERSRYAGIATGSGGMVTEAAMVLRESTMNLYKELSTALHTLVFLSRADIYWDTVVETEIVEEEATVYDLTVPRTSNFVGGHGPIVLHNTTAALAFAHDLYGEDYPRYLLELNASVTGDTPILARIEGSPVQLSFSELERIAEDRMLEELVVNDSRYIRVSGIEVPSYDAGTGRVEWSKVSWIIRHRAPAILRVRMRSGAELGITGNHSIMIMGSDGRITVSKASQLRPGSILLSLAPGVLEALAAETTPDPGREDPLPAEPFRKVLGIAIEGATLTRAEALSILARGPNGDPAAYRRLARLASSPIMADEVARIELVDGYDNPVYDVSVPGREVFFAGSPPLLLHNSDERGIETIRTKVKEFARSRVAGTVPFKLVLLDEADNMTADAQQALRRLMELYTATTRFILIANFPSKIIEPIQSRCAFFRFTPLRREDVIARLKWIAEQEGVEYEEEGLETIYDVSEGDMRRAINLLQAAAALGKVTTVAVYKVVGLAHPREVREMIGLALKGEFTAARDKLRQLMIEYGLSGLDIVKQMHREIFSGEIQLSEEQKVLAADYIGEIQYRLVEGGDDEIQLNALLAWLALLGAKLRAS